MEKRNRRFFHLMAGSIILLLAFQAVSIQALPSAQFAGPADYGIGQGPYYVAVADLNHDGNLDLISANYLDGSLSVLLGNGDGTFTAATNYPVSGGIFPGPQMVIAGDFNNHHQQDLVTSSLGTSTVEYFAGNGDGTFATPLDFNIDSGAYGLASGDFNGDGRLDVVAAAFGANELSILIGDSNQVFVAGTSLPTGDGPQAVAVADFDGDGKLDIVDANYYDNTVSVFLGNGDGTFGTRTDYDVGSRPEYVTTGDLNGDGNIDLIAVNSEDASVTVLLGQGDGTFSPGIIYPVGAYPNWVAVADLNGDGIPDLVVANAGNFSLSLLIGVGDGIFLPQVQIPLETLGYPFAVTAGDFNNDGRMDLVVASYWLNAASVLLNTSLPVLSLTQTNTLATLDWPAVPGFQLESTTNILSDNDWNWVTNEPTTNANRMRVSLPIIQPGEFFRLQQN